MPRDEGPAWPMQKVVGSAAAIPLRDDSIPLIVTSPAYNVAIDYPTGYVDLVPWPIYAQRARHWAAEMARVLQPSGRLFLNVQPTVPKVLGRSGRYVKNPPEPERVDLAGLWSEALLEAGLRYRDAIVWVQDSHDGGCQWGSWCRPSAPNMRGSWEEILVYFKGPTWKRTPKPVWKGWVGPRGEDGDILGGDWTDLARNVWPINPSFAGRKRRDDPEWFPASFPIEIPARAIRLSLWPNEVVLDPMAGGCVTGRAAEQLGRRSIMLDLAF